MDVRRSECERDAKIEPPRKNEVNSDWKKSYADSSGSLWPQRGEGKVHFHCKNTYVLRAFAGRSQGVQKTFGVIFLGGLLPVTGGSA